VQEPPNWVDEQRQRVEELIDGYRAALHDSLNHLTEDEARLRLVPSKATLLGLVKHASFVDGEWFDQAVTAGRTTRSASPPPWRDRAVPIRSSVCRCPRNDGREGAGT
jgi:hypothetical protein